MANCFSGLIDTSEFATIAQVDNNSYKKLLNANSNKINLSFLPPLDEIPNSIRNPYATEKQVQKSCGDVLRILRTEIKESETPSNTTLNTRLTNVETSLAGNIVPRVDDLESKVNEIVGDELESKIELIQTNLTALQTEIDEIQNNQTILNHINLLDTNVTTLNQTTNNLTLGVNKINQIVGIDSNTSTSGPTIITQIHDVVASQTLLNLYVGDNSTFNDEATLSDEVAQMKTALGITLPLPANTIVQRIASIQSDVSNQVSQINSLSNQVSSITTPLRHDVSIPITQFMSSDSTNPLIVQLNQGVYTAGKQVFVSLEEIVLSNQINFQLDVDNVNLAQISKFTLDTSTAGMVPVPSSIQLLLQYSENSNLINKFVSYDSLNQNFSLSNTPVSIQTTTVNSFSMEQWNSLFVKFSLPLDTIMYLQNIAGNSNPCSGQIEYYQSRCVIPAYSYDIQINLNSIRVIRQTNTMTQESMIFTPVSNTSDLQVHIRLI